MNVGIISMQKIHNYGSFLQAYSLKKIIESLGHSCDFIDIKPGEKIFAETQRSKKKYISKIDKYFMKRIRHYFFSKKRNINFQKIYFKWLGLNEETNWNKHYDLIIIGSDEVFNCTQKSSWGLSPNLLGGDIDADRIITYAASCGYTTYNRVKEYGLEEKISRLLINIDTFSVRDKNTADFIKKLVKKEPAEHLDPVFIYDFEDEIKYPNIKYAYILIYAYDGRIKDKDEINSIKSFAQKNDLKIISVGLYQVWCDKNISADPFELLGYVRNAKYVVTDTFHGTIFSIKYNKQFAVLIRDSNEEKISDLLERFNLESQRINDVKNLCNILNKTINYTQINKLISDQKEKSEKYLTRNLQ